MEVASLSLSAQGTLALGRVVVPVGEVATVLAVGAGAPIVLQSTAAASHANAAGPIGATGKVGEQFLRRLGGQSQVFFRTSRGGRFVDQLIGGIAHEAKVGYTALTEDIATQVAKDAELIETRQIDGATWRFFRSPSTGLCGPSAPLRGALEQAGISIVIH